MRYFLEISYNGADYHGWQIQPNAITVQEVLQEKLSILLRETIEVIGAGRTDARVHAKQMFLHLDVEKDLGDLKQLCFRLNSFLPKDIAVCRILEVPRDAHARFDAISREYHYLVSTQKDPFLSGFAWNIRSLKLDVDAMNLAASKLLKHTYYKCFSRSNTDVQTYDCTISKAIWVEDNNVLRFEVVANRFLRNMVRAMVGTLIEVGKGNCTQEEFEAILNSGDRKKAGASAPAHGLYLYKIVYPEEIISSR